MAEKQTILVADDEPAIRDVLQMMLEGEGYRILEACNAREAVEQAEQADLVILYDAGRIGNLGLRADQREDDGSHSVPDGQIRGARQGTGIFCRRRRLSGETIFLYGAFVESEGADPALQGLSGKTGDIGGSGMLPGYYH